MRALARAALLLLLWGGASAAEEAVPIPPSEFRSYAEGYTLYFSYEGLPFGTEEFHAGDRSVWKYEGGDCQRGRWYVRGAQLCFLYEDSGGPLCWRVLRDSQGYLARLLGTGDGTGMELRVTGRDRRPLLCGDLGV